MTVFNVQEIRFWCRRDTAANWTSVNPILASGEWGVETDNTGATPRKFKMGDGVTAWASLPYSDPATQNAAFLAAAHTWPAVQTFTASPVIDMGSTAGGLKLSSTAGTVSDVRWQTAGVDRWIARKNGDAESGANAGSKYEFHARADDGSLIGLVYDITRSTRVLDFKVAPTVNGAAIGGGSTPTGTGFTHVAGGVQDAAAVTIDGQGTAVAGDVPVIAPGTHAATSKATPVDNDELPLVDSAASNVLKKLTWANLKAGIWSAWGALINAGTAKTSPVNGDYIAIMDSAASNATKKVALSDLKTYIGSAGGGIAAGTSNPGSPSTNDLFYRTNLGLLIYYDGTRWLTVNEYCMAVGTGSSIPASTWVFINVRTDFQMYLTKWTTSSFISGTNDLSNYWNFALNYRSASNASTNIDNATTAVAATSNTWVQTHRAINAPLNSAARAFAIVTSGTGAPGGLFPTLAIYYRLIVT